MSYFPTIRYEYAEESNSSQPSVSADPPLFKEEHYFLDSANDPTLSFPPSVMMQMVDDENMSPSPQFSPFVDSNHHHAFLQPQSSSSAADYYWHDEQSQQQRKEQQPPQQQMLEQYQQHSQQQPSVQQKQLTRHGEFAAIKQEPLFPAAADQHRHQFSAHQNNNFANSLPPFSKGADAAIMPFADSLLQQQRTPFRSMENVSTIKAPKNFGYTKEENSPFKTNSSAIPAKRVSGPPAHWRVEDAEQKPKRNKKPGAKQEIVDENGRQIVIVKGQSDGPDPLEDDQIAELDDSGDRDVGPPVARNGFVKPTYSYSCLIGLSLKNSESGELTVSEIYTFLCHHFPYFREAPSGWKNSVRHNLSLNKCFQKIEVETPGTQGRKSCLWRMNPAKCGKMDQELRKWRDRDEPRIRTAMEHPESLDDLQNGIVGMPPNMKPRRFSIPIHKSDGNSIVRSSPSTANNSLQQKKLLHRVSNSAIKNIVSNQQQTLSQSFASSSDFEAFIDDNNPTNQIPHYAQQNSADLQQIDSQEMALTSGQLQMRESVHAQAARKLENLLQQQKTLDPADNNCGMGGSFGGFTLIGGGGQQQSSGAGVGNKKRRSSESVCSSTTSSAGGHSSSRRQSNSAEHNNNTHPYPHQQQHMDSPTNGGGVISSSVPPPATEVEQQQQHPQTGRQQRAMAASVLYDQLCGTSHLAGRLEVPHRQRHYHHDLPNPNMASSAPQQYSAQQQQQQHQSLMKQPPYGGASSSHARGNSQFGGVSGSGALDSCERALAYNALDTTMRLPPPQSPK